MTVMISTTGRRPSMAAPIAAPTKPSSAIGVSMTRSAPELLQQAGRDLVRALELTDLFPHEHDRAIAPHLLGERVVQRLAIRDYCHGACPGSADGWLGTSVCVAELEQLLGVRLGALVGELDRGVDDLLDLVVNLIQHRRVDSAFVAQSIGQMQRPGLHRGCAADSPPAR